ncbi:MAG TPA: glycosyltransferase 87 family protein [Cryptosporangiaceae bacterium]|nr:glycosyltransferase 87 family protein [Cryptosporangiaceae bacterium]
MYERTARGSDNPIVLPSHTDGVPAGLSQAVGGPLGDHATLRRRFWTPTRIVLALVCLMMAFNWVQKAPCRDGAWANYSQYRNVCYTDVLALYYAERLDRGAVPYLDHDVEYPVLTGVMMGVIGLPVNALVENGLLPDLYDLFGLGEPNEGTIFYDLTALALGAFALLTAWAIVQTRRQRPWDAAMFALAPAAFLTATVNWDLLAIGLTALAIYAWARKRPVLAGVLFGLAVAAKFYPLLILGPLVLLCIRRRRPEVVGAGLTTVGVAVVTWVAVNLPVYLAAPKAWSTFYTFSSERGVDWGTFWYIGTHVPWLRDEDGKPRAGLPWFNDLAADVPRLNMVGWALFVLCCVGIAVLILKAPRRPRLGAMAFLVVAAFLLTNKVWSQQFVLWLIPLAVLARPKWGAFLAWQACELAYFFGFYQILLRAAGGKALLPETAFTLVSIARWVSVATLCGLVVYEVLRPEHDVVRRGGVDDPQGGVLDETPPAWPPPDDAVAAEPVSAGRA